MSEKETMEIKDAEFEKVDQEPAKTDEEKQETSPLEEENTRLKDSLVRLQADFENYKKRIEKERANYIDLGVRKLANDLLPALDNLYRALDSIDDHGEDKEIKKGIKLIEEQLIEVFNKHKIYEIKAEGEPFDPNLHHAVAVVEDDQRDPDMVVDVLQKGYMIDETVMRPSMVRVSKTKEVKGDDINE